MPPVIFRVSNKYPNRGTTSLCGSVGWKRYGSSNIDPNRIDQESMPSHLKPDETGDIV